MHPSSSSAQRITTVDALRGFALFGILLAHFIYWYSGAALPQSTYEKFTDTGSTIASVINGIFISGKFFTFFSFLFGLSFFLQMQSLEKKEERFVLRYCWRLLTLGIIGLLHHAFWRGDILSIYVPLGFILLFIRNISNRLLFIIAMLLVINLPARIIEIVHLLFPSPAGNNAAATPLPVDNDAALYYAAIKHGSLIDVIKNNWDGLSTKFSFQFQSGRIYITLGFFMLGMYAGRRKWFEQPELYKPIIKRICKYSGLITLGIVLFALGLIAVNDAFKLSLETKPPMQLLFGFLFDTAGSSMTVFYLAGLTMLMYRSRWQKLLFPLAPVGKMALTVYLSQTFFGLLLFYNIGFGLFEKTAPWLNMMIAIPVFLIQIYLCRTWLRYFNYGPVEWLWRSCTFLKWYPLKKTNQS